MKLLLLLAAFVNTLYWINAHEICYYPYGCFSDDPPFHNALVQLPQHPDKVGTKFFYYTRETRNNPKMLYVNFKKTASSSNFKPNRTTVIFTHGYIENKDRWYVSMFVDALLKYEDMNVIFIEWARGAFFPYHQAFGNARLVGAQMAYLVHRIRNDTGIDLEKLRLVGFSLGAHIVGYAGRNLRRSGLFIPRITGLDPAAPYYEGRHIDVRLDPSDAQFVDVIHTDSKTIIINGFGTVQKMGHIDFFPNGGYHQIGCGKIDIGIVQYFACSHYRSVRYYIESVNSPCPFYGYPCSSWNDFEGNNCSVCPSEGCPKMGYHIRRPSQLLDKKFYMYTHDEFPYCGYHYEFTIYTKDAIFADLNNVIVIELIGEQGNDTVTLSHKYYARGSTEVVLGLGRKDIGDLVSMTVKHEGLVEVWYLHAIKIKILSSQEEYTACYGIWLNNYDNGRKLKHNHSPSSCK